MWDYRIGKELTDFNCNPTPTESNGSSQPKPTETEAKPEAEAETQAKTDEVPSTETDKTELRIFKCLGYHDKTRTLAIAYEK